MKPSMYRADGVHRVATITPEIACQIVLMDANGKDRPTIAAKFGIAVSTVGRIINGHAWMAETLEVRRSVRRQKQEASHK